MLKEKFITELTAVGGEVICCKTYEQLIDSLAGVLAGLGVRKVMYYPHPQVKRLLEKIREKVAVELLTEDYRKPEEVEVGLTGADLGVAESGSLVLVAEDPKLRKMTTLPPVHIAVLEESQIVEKYEDVFEHYAGKLPGYLNFITGPSRTADIERVLTIGVHGPGRLIVFIKEGEE
ncbi:LutC/YkgG family protein [Carboxydothermus ferrireducens]|uniref:L-lactate dehydrogenase complex protein LldG n=1 Tax=Carboxydothermus ferrireducens DSM 11255 TaxID=1119529 RepID=A0ABX2R596_9THEO|nr:lactate utilization protein [Carboxydothermus ferrireducens]NYE56328.1 L-lactate dehydrogenase complex protein LldG [Carboxydothermus ferrireducens DSM 11255]